MLIRKKYYHIYNRGVDRADVFRCTNDFHHFLNRYKFYLGLSVETYAYCLLNNHFHLLIRVKSFEEEQQSCSLFPESDSNNVKYYIFPNPKKKLFDASTLFSHFLNSYSKYFNKKYDRSGPVWDGKFNRKLIETEDYLTHLICYIHRNPIHHGIHSNYTDYNFSSYSEILNNSSNLFVSSNVLSLFGGKENYIAAHQEIIPHVSMKKIFDDD